MNSAFTWVGLQNHVQNAGLPLTEEAGPNFGPHLSLTTFVSPRQTRPSLLSRAGGLANVGPC